MPQSATFLLKMIQVFWTARAQLVTKNYFRITFERQRKHFWNEILITMAMKWGYYIRPSATTTTVATHASMEVTGIFSVAIYTIILHQDRTKSVNYSYSSYSTQHVHYLSRIISPLCGNILFILFILFIFVIIFRWWLQDDLILFNPIFSLYL